MNSKIPYYVKNDLILKNKNKKPNLHKRKNESHEILFRCKSLSRQITVLGERSSHHAEWTSMGISAAG